MTLKTLTGATNSLFAFRHSPHTRPHAKQQQHCDRAKHLKNNRMKFQATTTTSLALLLCILLASSSFQVSMAGADFCDGKCKVRCSKASRHDDCLKYCGICCAACNCVPSGTSGNKDECPCYRDKTTGKGDHKRPKCP